MAATAGSARLVDGWGFDTVTRGAAGLEPSTAPQTVVSWTDAALRGMHHLLLDGLNVTCTAWHGCGLGLWCGVKNRAWESWYSTMMYHTWTVLSVMLGNGSVIVRPAWIVWPCMLSCALICCPRPGAFTGKGARPCSRMACARCHLAPCLGNLMLWGFPSMLSFVLVTYMQHRGLP